MSLQPAKPVTRRGPEVGVGVEVVGDDRQDAVDGIRAQDPGASPGSRPCPSAVSSGAVPAAVEHAATRSMTPARAADATADADGHGIPPAGALTGTCWPRRGRTGEACDRDRPRSAPGTAGRRSRRPRWRMPARKLNAARPARSIHHRMPEIRQYRTASQPTQTKTVAIVARRAASRWISTGCTPMSLRW